jgi:hypothetical protein
MLNRYMGISSVLSASYMSCSKLRKNQVLGIRMVVIHFCFFFTSICNDAEDSGIWRSFAGLFVSDVCNFRIAFKVQEALKEFFCKYKRILEH